MKKRSEKDAAENERRHTQTACFSALSGELDVGQKHQRKSAVSSPADTDSLRRLLHKACHAKVAENAGRANAVTLKR
jgi:hypothetical protein